MLLIFSINTCKYPIAGHCKYPIAGHRKYPIEMPCIFLNQSTHNMLASVIKWLSQLTFKH